VAGCDDAAIGVSLIQLSSILSGSRRRSSTEVKHDR